MCINPSFANGTHTSTFHTSTRMRFKTYVVVELFTHSRKLHIYSEFLLNKLRSYTNNDDTSPFNEKLPTGRLTETTFTVDGKELNFGALFLLRFLKDLETSLDLPKQSRSDPLTSQTY